MQVPSDEVLAAAIRAAFARRGAAADDVGVAVAHQVGRGILRLARGPLPHDPVAQQVVDYLLAGRRDMPPYPYRAQLEPQLRSLLEEAEAPIPAPETLTTLVNLGIGWILERSGPMPPGFRGAVVREFAGLYLAGA